ncbi:alanine--tRNA ligase [Mycoplasmopsis hyopharyngis]|uniref:alanine--tRNA ligase n=1 Tax=Mycoplasmopsis hyopharyngis TaxID=29558 RepID=UPI0038735D81
MSSKEIRQSWLDFFKSKNHLVVETKSLVPVNDNSLLWINSGVATLKDYFSGKKIPPAYRLTNSQKSIRTNDIENVGFTSRHHTFFEMLGNFSIGNYFKKEAIEFATEYLLKVLKMPKEKLYFTYFKEDTETRDLWIANGFDKDHLIPGDKKTNFWEVGAGPCGPNTEIFFDRGTKYDSRGIELLKNDIENDRYIEIWNIVFSTFNSDGEGNYTELKQKNIDTGAGLERIVSIMQDVPTNYDSDLFMPIIKEIEKYTPKNVKYDVDFYFAKQKDQEQNLINVNFKIIADHLRTVANAIADGVKPSNVGRGYIIRRLIRRSIYKAMQLGIANKFLYKLVNVVKESLPFEYEVNEVAEVIKNEEELFSKTIENGKTILDKFLVDNKTKIFDGYLAFKLFETYGFPIELTTEILSQNNIEVDLKEFEKAKEEHIEKSRSEKVSGMQMAINSLVSIDKKLDQFVGYDLLKNKTKIIKLLDAEKEVKTINGKAYLILEQTPFYATSGGQNHDHGYLIQGKNKIKVLDVFKDKFANHIHYVEGKIDANKEIKTYVDEEKRLNLARNHSATHLVFSALRKVLGPQIQQLGSDITFERFTFDFPADEKPTEEQIEEIEKIMKDIIAKDIKREYLITDIENAKKLNAIMTIEETEYLDPKHVRVVKWGNVTTDLCGGTHLPNSGILEKFKIISVEKKQAGIFRIKVVTSNKLVDKYYKEQIEMHQEELTNLIQKCKELDSTYKCDYKLTNNLEKDNNLLYSLILKVREDYKKINKENEKINFDFEKIEYQQLSNIKTYVNLDVKVKELKNVTCTIREKDVNSLVICGSILQPGQIMLAIASKTYDSLAIFNKITSKFKGKGGGNKILAMGKIEADVADLIKFLNEENLNA